MIVGVVLAVFVMPLALAAQQAGRVAHIGILRAGSPPDPYVEALRQGLRELGYIEGRNISSPQPPLRTEPYNLAFVDKLREVGFVEGRDLVIEFRSAQGRIDRLPELAMVAIDNDPVATGHISSLARPGGRITGVSLQQTDLAAKRLQLLTEFLPRARRIAVFADTSTVGQLVPRTPTDSGIGDEASLALDVRQCRVGGRRRAALVRAELLGAEMPVEQPTAFELVINLKAAKVLGITIPQSLRARADRVIE